jgi:hypothetical protein
VKLPLLGAAAVLLIGLTACGTSQPAPQPTPEPIPSPIQVSEKYINQNTFEFQKKLKDGRTVTCVVWQEYQEGGVSCDWPNAK